jgi:hypothetical protein
MKFSGFSLAFIAAVAAPSVGASDASASSLRGRGHDKDSSIMTPTPTRLLKPDPDLLPAQANTDMPELPSEAQANVNDNGKENGRPFGNAATTTTTTSTTAGYCAGGWLLNKAYCYDPVSECVTFTICPTSDAAGNTIGGISNSFGSFSIDLDSFTSNKEISVSYIRSSVTIRIFLTLSDDGGNSFTTGSGTTLITYSITP